MHRGGKPDRGVQNCVVVIAVGIKHPKGFGRVRMRHVADASGGELVPFVCATVASDAPVLTAGWKGYNQLSARGYTHKRTVRAHSGEPAHVAMPGVHRVASLLKRWLLGIDQGSVEPAHLQSYLDEYTFNRRTATSRGLVLRRLLEQAVATQPVTKADVTHGNPWDPHHPCGDSANRLPP